MTTATHSELELEAIRICQELIRIPSVNYGEGKGDEKDVAAHVVKLLSEVGIVSQTYESAPGRCNVIARIKGSNPNRPGLVVHGHLDVVPVNAADWSVDPFSAEIKDGFIYFYRLTDSDLLSSPNRITLGSSQNGSLTATVNNPEQALLNIQSSTNLIDWNTLKTILNEPSFKIVVPANKKQEFIRAIESY